MGNVPDHTDLIVVILTNCFLTMGQSASGVGGKARGVSRNDVDCPWDRKDISSVPWDCSSPMGRPSVPSTGTADRGD